MKVKKRQYNEKLGKWEFVFVEEDGDFVFSIGTNVPKEKIKQRKKNE